MPSTPSSLVRRFSTALASDLSGQTDLVELTYALVLRNFLSSVRECSTRLDRILNIIVPYMILLGGLYGTFKHVGIFGELVTDLWDWVTIPFSSKVTIPADHSLNASVLAWLTSRGLVGDARNLALAGIHSKPITWVNSVNSESENDDGVAESSSSPPLPLNFIPDFGRYRFRYKGHFMSMERRNDGTRTRCLDPTSPQNLALE
jgi:hypothetical protein